MTYTNEYGLNLDTHDGLIMKLRTLASLRGASPVEIQRNVLALEGNSEYSDCLRNQYIDFPEWSIE